MLSKIGQALSHSPDGFSLAPGSMLLRLRRASLGMLCLVGAVGLGLIAFIAQLDWPDVLSGPLPGGSTKVGRVDDAVGLAGASPARGAATVSPGRAARRVTTSAVRGGRSPASAGRQAGIGHSRDLATAPPQPSPGSAQPAAPADDGEPAEATPAASAVPVAAGNGRGSSKGSAKATADGGKATADLTASKSKGQKSSAKSSAPASSNSAGSAAAKAHQDESAAGKSPAPAPEPEAKPSPAAGPASAKEAADAANSK